MKNQNFLIVALIAAGAWAAYYSTYIAAPDADDAALHGEALIGGEFALTDHHGVNVTNDSYKGKYRLVFFGFTHCPDVCPATLGLITDVLSRMKPEDADKIAPLFITVDPKRDTPQVMAEYIEQYDHRIIGLTGTQEQIKQAEDAYRVYVAVEPVEAPKGHGEHGEDHHHGEMTINHSAYTYLMDPEGKYLTHFNDKEKPAGIAQTIESFIR